MTRTDCERRGLGESPTPLRILLLENSGEDSLAILKELEGAGIHFEPTAVTHRSEFLSAIGMQEYAAVLSAYNLAEWNGLEALKELRTAGRGTPFILVTGVLRDEEAVECMKQDVDDYILKRSLKRLPMALQHVMEEKALRDANSRQ